MFSLCRGDHEAFEQRARKAAAIETFRIRWLVVGDLRRGDYPAARARFVDGVPELFVIKSLKAMPDYDADFLKVMATELAHVLQHTGEEQRARALLELTEAYLKEELSVGDRESLKGSSTIDVVAIHALRGETSLALAKLREVDAASIYTSALTWQYHRDFDPRLESIRDEPEFKAFFAGIEAEMAAQRARLAARPKDAPLVIEKVAGLKEAAP
jgi:hypothetical protein